MRSIGTISPKVLGVHPSFETTGVGSALLAGYWLAAPWIASSGNDEQGGVLLLRSAPQVRNYLKFTDRLGIRLCSVPELCTKVECLSRPSYSQRVLQFAHLLLGGSYFVNIGHACTMDALA